MSKPVPEHDNEHNLPEESEIFDQLAAEEPPIVDGDTNPSATKPRPAIDANVLQPLVAGRSGMVIVALAVIMVVVAGALLLMGGDDEAVADATATQVVVDDATQQPNMTNTPRPAPTSDATPTVIANDPRDRVLPTAAADEQLLALMTPVPQGNTSGNAVQRDNVPFTEQIGLQEDNFVTYVVQRGDTLDKIRQNYNLDLCTIVWSNDRNRVSPLQPGNEIIIPPVDGVYAKIRETQTIQQLAEETGVDPFVIINSPYNAALFDATPDSLLLEGLQVMVPGGKGGDCNIWGEGPTVVSSDGGSTSNTGTYNLWGCQATVTGGGFPVGNPMGGNYNFFQGFSPSHTGVDLAANEGTPVYSAGLGTVVFAGWNQYGYGNTIVIAHGTTFTLYAHLSSINVRCGQDVSGGQTIGLVGNTGRSSGPHLHFEIRDAGFNPLNPVFTIGF